MKSGERAQRLVFGDDAEQYDRVRPSYPDELIDDVVALVGIPCRAVDAGCGTGKATVMLAERGVEGVGVEPDPAMADVARRRLSAYPAWRVDVADFEEWEPARGARFDLVTCAQAWHWIDRERGTTRAELLLRSGGWLAIFGRVPDPPDTPLRRQIDAIYAELAPKPSVVSQAPEERVAPGAAFGSPLRREYPGFEDYSADEWIALMETSSDHKVLPARDRRLLLSRVRDAIDGHGGTYRHHCVCRLWVAQRL